MLSASRSVCIWKIFSRPGLTGAGNCSAKCAQQVVVQQRDAAPVIMVSSHPGAPTSCRLPGFCRPANAWHFAYKRSLMDTKGDSRALLNWQTLNLHLHSECARRPRNRDNFRHSGALFQKAGKPSSRAPAKGDLQSLPASHWLETKKKRQPPSRRTSETQKQTLWR